ncbi:MAG: hypothetical protein K2K37_00370 [Muribaculaceae bacterium]|nr:hypothetical protein [Muribaculaceae bacterium]
MRFLRIHKLCGTPHPHVELSSLGKRILGNFDACCAGKLLQISPFDFRMQKEAITREKCLILNALAEDIAAGLR